jgi:hypothetical protein
MQKSLALTACETFRQSVLLSINSMSIDEDLRADLAIKLQTFYLSMLLELVATPPPSIDEPPTF